MDQRGSIAFSMSLQHVAAVRTHGSCVMRPDSWLMCQASGSCVRRPTHVACVPLTWHASGVRRQTHASHASGVRLMAHASGVRLMAHASGVRLMAHASGVRRQASHSRGMRQASGVRLMRPTLQASTCPIQPIQPIQPPPLSVMTTTKRRHFPMLPPSDLRPLSCMAWGNTTLLPTPYSSMGTNKNSGRRS